MSHANAWFPCYVNDLLGSMRWKMMTPAQRGAYWQLICWQMQSDDGHLVNDLDALSTLADLDLYDHKIVLDSFPVSDNGKRANLRALKEWAKRRAISGVRSDAGSKGIAKRWQADSKPIANGIANALQTDSKRHSKPIAIATTTTTTTTDTSTTTPTSMLGAGVCGSEDVSICPQKCSIDHPHDWPLSFILSISSHPTVACSESDATAYHTHFASVGWIDGSGRRIVDVAARLRKWKVDQASHGKSGGASGGQSAAQSARPESAHALKLRIDTANEEREALHRKGAFRTDAENARMMELTNQVKAWKKQITEG